MHVCHTQARATIQTRAHCAYGQLHCVTLRTHRQGHVTLRTHRQGHGRSLLDRAQHPTQGSLLLKTTLEGFRMYVLRSALLCVCTPLLTALTKSLSFRVTGSPSQCWIGWRHKYVADGTSGYVRKKECPAPGGRQICICKPEVLITDAFDYVSEYHTKAFQLCCAVLYAGAYVGREVLTSALTPSYSTHI